MIKFKSYLIEYLTADQRKKFSGIKMTSKAKSATDPFFGKEDIKREELQDYDHDKSEVHKKVEQHLQQEIPREDYAKGIISDKYGRQAKIGRMIRDDSLRNEFASDSSRAGSRTGSNHYMTIVRGTEVAGQTNSSPDKNHPKGHSWGEISCKNVDTGMNKHYLEHEIKHGSVVVRAHDHNDQEVYRATLHPYENDQGHVMYGVNSEYGIKHPSFTKHAQDVAARLSGDHKGGSPMYYINDRVYNDMGGEAVIHPGSSEEDIHTALKDENIDVEDKATMIENHPKINPDHLNTAFSNEHEAGLRASAVAHPLADQKLLDKGMNDNSSWVRIAAMNNENSTTKHIEKGLADPNIQVVAAALKNPRIPSKHLDAAMESPVPDIRVAATSNPKASKSHINKALGDNNENVRRAAVQSPHVSREQLMDVIKNDQPAIANVALHNKNITKEHIDAALEVPSPDVRFMALEHPKATPEHVEKGLKDANYYVRAAAVQSRHATLDHIKNALANDPSDFVKFKAKKAYKAKTGEEYDSDKQ
jgi:hypothetical protein